MDYDPAVHHRRSIRLRGYDYSQPGAYFVTLCTHKRKRLFGEILNGEMKLNNRGWKVVNHWEWLAKRYDYVSLDEFIVMPNHLHGIVVLTKVDDASKVSGQEQSQPTHKRKPLGRLIGAFKTASTNQINRSSTIIGSKLWQRGFWEHIIRNEQELNLIRAYIRNNPAQWGLDNLNAKRQVSSASDVGRSSGGSLPWECH